jgi:(2S)-methylsuccinyl-CoA dehydrogenase
MIDSLSLLQNHDLVFKTVDPLLEKICKTLAQEVKDPQSPEPRLDRNKLQEIQPEAFELARLLAEQAAAKAISKYAQKMKGVADYLEMGLAHVYLGEFVKNLNQMIFGREKRFGLADHPLAPVKEFLQEVLGTEHFTQLGQALLARGKDRGGSYGLSSDHEGIREAFSRFAQEQIAPLAEEIHRKDQLIPEKIIKGLCELGVFGISIPEEFGGNFMDHRTMIIATEELSVASLGAGGSVITRPEICAKAILTGGTEQQKKKWLPLISSGEAMVCVAVTEPNAGSDVANVRVQAQKVAGGYRINGEKTWCTFAGRANLFILLARTSGEGHKGLTLFLVEKPAFTSETKADEKNNQYDFLYEQEKGGKIEGHAIPTIGYRGMHSFSVIFEDYFVPDENRIGDEGEGFKIQMKGFSGGRIQTAARALGVMQAAFHEAVRYCEEREVFGQKLGHFPLPKKKLIQMAARIQAGRQLTYQIGDLMDDHKGEREASLVKLLTCADAEFVTREAMQLHGGMGYSEEYPVSRYWADARVLSIFEGAEEVLALMVIARQTLGDHLS